MDDDSVNLYYRHPKFLHFWKPIHIHVFCTLGLPETTKNYLHIKKITAYRYCL